MGQENERNGILNGRYNMMSHDATFFEPQFPHCKKCIIILYHRFVIRSQCEIDV